jgi:hypothetical protein
MPEITIFHSECQRIFHLFCFLLFVGVLMVLRQNVASHNVYVA